MDLKNGKEENDMNKIDKETSYEAVIFDMDGVIFDSECATLGCWKELAKRYDIPNIEEPYFKCIGTTMERTKEIVMETYGENFPYDKYEAEISAMYHEKYDDGRLPMKTGVRELLTYLKENRKKIALASSTHQKIVIRQLKAAGILSFFDVVIGGDMVKRSKPAPDIFLKACEMLEADPAHSLCIEDSYHGIQAAYRGGLRPIMVPDLLAPTEEIRALTETVQDSLQDVIVYLRGEAVTPCEQQS